MTQTWVTEHFLKSELSCHHCGALAFSPSDLIAIEELRVQWDHPMTINSAYRCPAHPEELKKPGGPGAHTLFCALDIRIHGESAYNLLKLAIQLGWGGLGFSQKGPVGGRFLHIDRGASRPTAPRPAIWSY